MVKLVDKSPYFLIDGYPRELEQGTRFESDVSSPLTLPKHELEKNLALMQTEMVISTFQDC